MSELMKRISSHSEYFNKMINLLPAYAQQTSYATPNAYGIFDKSRSGTDNSLKENGKKEKDDDDDEEEEDDEKIEPTPDILPGFVDSQILQEREELRKKLREKLNEFRAKRNAPPITNDPDSKSAEPPPKRRKVEKKPDKKDKKPKTKQQMTPNKTPPSKNQLPTSKNSDDAIEYSTFDFSKGDPVPTYLRSKRKTSKAELLKKLQEKKKKQQELQGTEEGENLAKQEAWEVMKKKALGEKVKTDTEKLKKSIKREQQQKKKSKREWDQRISSQKKSQKDAQKKRQDNIALAKERKKDKRLGIKRKKTTSKTQRPGFEGAKRQYLNK